MNEQLKIIISAEVAKFKKGVDEAEKEVKSFKEQVADAGKNIEETMKNAGASISNHIKTGAKAAAVGLAAVSAALVGAAVGTEEYRKNQAKLATAFQTAGASAEEATSTYNDLYRVLGDDGQATEAAAHLAQLTTEEKALNEWTNICQGVYATFGDSLPIEGLTEAANETAKVGQVTGGLADALNWAGVSEDAFNEKLAACNSEAEREKLIRDTLNGIYSEASANYEKNAADTLAQNEAQAKLTASLARVGEAIAPVITLFTQFAADALERVAPVVEKLAQKLIPVLSKVLQTAASWTSKIIGFVVDNWGIIAAIAGVIAGICAAIGIYNTVTAIKAAMDAAQVTTVWGLVAAHIAQAAAAMAALAPYLLIVAAIAAVIAIIVLCVKYWDEIVAAVKKAIAAIVNVLKDIGNWINENVIQPIVGFFSGLWEGLKNGFKAAWDFIKGIWNTVASFFNDYIIQPIANFFSGMWNGLKNGAKAAWEGIKSVFSGLANFFKNIFSNAWEGVKKVFSTGGKVFKGIGEGILSVFKTVVNALIKGINTVVSLPFKGLNTILDKISGLKILSVRPFKWLTWRAPVPQIPYLAKGGIIDSATIAMVGEQGKEAVVPLENNLGWLDKLSGMLAERMGMANTPIKLYVDKKVLAESSISGINDLTRQTGSLPLVLV